MSDITVTNIILALFFLVALYFLLAPNASIKNDGNLVRSEDNSISVSVDYEDGDMNSEDSSAEMEMNTYDDSMDSSLEIIKERSLGRNALDHRRRNGGAYRENSYRSTEKDLDSIDSQFMVQDVAENHNDRYMPLDESAGVGAPINIGDREDNDATKYNVNAFLPQEENKDWFETIETVESKNSHLINLYRPIGVNTIGSSNKGASYDLRGFDGAINPKFVTGPFLNSSWEPHRATKSLCA